MSEPLPPLAEILLEATDIAEETSRAVAASGDGRLRAIIESEPACVKLLDRAGRLIDMNRTGLAMIEAASLDQVRGHPLVALVDERYRDAYLRMCADVLAGRSSTLLFEARTLRGAPRWLQSFAVPIRTEGAGAIDAAAMIVVTHDVTRQMHDQAALRERTSTLEDHVADRTAELLRLNRALEGEIREREVNAERFRRAQRIAGIGTWDADIDRGTASWSEMMRAILGYPEGAVETTYEAFLRQVHPDDLDRLQEKVNDCLERGVPYDLEHRVLLPDGSVRWVHGRGDVVRDAGDGVTRMLGALQDITERKRAEEAQARLLAILEATPDVIFTATVDGVVTHLNRAARRMLALPADAISDSGFPAPADWCIEGMARRVAEREGSWTGEALLSTASGDLVPVQQTVVAHRDSQGALTHFSAVNRDLRAHKRHAAELTRLKERAEAASRAKSEFLSRMSHELRTPLNAMLGFAQILEMDGASLGDESRNLVERIQKAGWHLLELIDDVLDLGSIEAGTLNVGTAPVDAARAIDEAVALIEPEATPRGIRITVERPKTESAWVYADETRLREVLLNLLSNAVKYNRAKGSVVVKVWRADHRTCIAVRDTGHGLTRAQMERLFEPFNRLGAEERGIPGTGMGLVISRRLAEAMGGRIQVESSPDAGSVFTVDLPSCEAPTDVNASQPPVLVGLRDPSDVRGRVLYVEDDSENADLVRMILGLRPGVELLTAHDGALGVRLALASRPDVVILDLHLPDTDGYEICRRLRADPALANVPIIALTASAMPEQIELATATGFTDYLTKPVDVAAFLRTIDSALALATVS